MIRRILLKWLGLNDVMSELDQLREYVNSHAAFVNKTVAELKEYTRVDADISASHRGSSSVIVTGVYRNQGFVQFYDMGDKEFSDIVDFMNHKQRHAMVRVVDSHPSFKGVFWL